MRKSMKNQPSAEEGVDLKVAMSKMDKGRDTLSTLQMPTVERPLDGIKNAAAQQQLPKKSMSSSGATRKSGVNKARHQSIEELPSKALRSDNV